MAGHAVPVLDRHIGAGRVVVGEYGPYQQEEITDPATDQRVVDGYGRVSSAEAGPAYVWMGHVAVALCRLWIKGDDMVCVGSAYLG